LAAESAPETQSAKLLPQRAITPGLVWALAGVLAIAVLGVILAVRFVDGERERELRGWQARLGLVADARAAAIGDWLQRQHDTLRGLAENSSLQVYMTELSPAPGQSGQATDEAGQGEYLRSLLVVTADRAGFTGEPVGPAVRANVQRVGVAGLALVDRQGRVLVATPDMPPIDGRLRDFAVNAGSEPAMLDMYPGPAGRPTIAFFAPVFAVQANPGSQRIGGVIGVKEVDRQLFPLLVRPPVAEKSAETLLVRRSGATIEYISPLADGTPAMRKRLAADTPLLAGSFAIKSPGGFEVLRDHRDAEVLVTGRAIASTPWTLVQKVDRAEALGESDQRLNRMLMAFLLGIVALMAIIITFWQYGASRRAGAAAERLAELSGRFESQRNLLRLITDSQTAAIFIADAEGHVQFANDVVAARAGVAAQDLVGKTLASVFGPAEARRYVEGSRIALESHAVEQATHRDEEGGATRVLRAQHIPLTAGSDARQRVLVVEDDITAAVVERERRERSQRLLVRTLVAVVDSRDRFAAHHSQRVAMVARRVAEEMDLDPTLAEAAEIAGNLLNLGKIFVPPELLAKQGKLADDELQKVRAAIRRGTELLDDIDFDAPVVRTLHEAGERWDGSGPRGLKGEEISIAARVVAVANAFVALVSHRAFRPGVGFDEAIETLQRDVGRAFDRRVVTALINDLENRGGRARWAEFGTPPD
jgi:PAS domain S-box-containing protein